MVDMKKKSARNKILEHFLKNVGKKISTEELAEIAGIREYARRIRELRDEYGYDIQSHRDRNDLHPGEYILTSSTQRKSTERDISPALRAKILARDGYTCQVCGAGAGEPHPLNPKRKVRLQIDHIVPVSEGGSNEEDNLRVLCSVCNEGRSNLDLSITERSINLLAIIRRAPRDNQLEVYKFLKNKFEPEASSSN